MGVNAMDFGKREVEMRYGPPPQGPPLVVPYRPLAPHQSIRRRTKKRLAGVGAVAAAVLAWGGTYATTLTVTANQVGAGSYAVSLCDTDGVTVVSGDPLLWDDTAGKHYFDFVTVNGIDPSCDQHAVYVQPQRSDGTALGDGGYATFDNGPSDSGTSVIVPLTGDHVFMLDYSKTTVAIHD